MIDGDILPAQPAKEGRRTGGHSGPMTGPPMSLSFMAFLPKLQEKPVERYGDVIRQCGCYAAQWNLI
jgi:hypothetical protein